MGKRVGDVRMGEIQCGTAMKLKHTSVSADSVIETMDVSCAH